MRAAVDEFRCDVIVVEAIDLLTRKVPDVLMTAGAP
jgi:hypothetical protein